MKRLKKILQPHMVSGRIEQSAFDTFKSIMSRQSYLTLQDFIVFVFDLFNSGKIGFDKSGKNFQLITDTNVNDPE